MGPVRIGSFFVTCFRILFSIWFLFVELSCTKKMKDGEYEANKGIVVRRQGASRDSSIVTVPDGLPLVSIRNFGSREWRALWRNPDSNTYSLKGPLPIPKKNIYSIEIFFRFQQNISFTKRPIVKSQVRVRQSGFSLDLNHRISWIDSIGSDDISDKDSWKMNVQLEQFDPFRGSESQILLLELEFRNQDNPDQVLASVKLEFVSPPSSPKVTVLSREGAEREYWNLGIRGTPDFLTLFAVFRVENINPNEVYLQFQNQGLSRILLQYNFHHVNQYTACSVVRSMSEHKEEKEETVFFLPLNANTFSQFPSFIQQRDFSFSSLLSSRSNILVGAYILGKTGDFFIDKNEERSILAATECGLVPGCDPTKGSGCRQIFSIVKIGSEQRSLSIQMLVKPNFVFYPISVYESEPVYASDPVSDLPAWNVIGIYPTFRLE